MNENLEHLEAQLQALCDKVTGAIPPKDKAPYILFVNVRPFANGPIVTFTCSWMETIINDGVVFRCGFMGGYLTFTAKMVTRMTQTKTAAGIPGTEMTLQSAESWQNA